MIRYAITSGELASAVENEKRGWIVRAAERTAAFRALGKYQESSSIWSEVKPAYMRLQGDKCAYCERKLEAADFGMTEQDIDHDRPKRRVAAWYVRKSLVLAGVMVSPTPNVQKVYYLLPYNLFNYAAACTPCNRVLKRSQFPISGLYNLDADDPFGLANTEKPLLIYPIGILDDDPESLIEFTGLSPQARLAAGFERHRALVTIDFFHLDDAIRRKNLFRDRATILLGLFPQLQKMNGTGTEPEKARARAVVDSYLKDNAPHANCARSFERLFSVSPAEAAAHFALAEELILSGS